MYEVGQCVSTFFYDTFSGVVFETKNDILVQIYKKKGENRTSFLRSIGDLGSWALGVLVIGEKGWSDDKSRVAHFRLLFLL